MCYSVCQTCMHRRDMLMCSGCTIVRKAGFSWGLSNYLYDPDAPHITATATATTRTEGGSPC